MNVDAFTLAVVHSSLIAIARDMKIMTMRTAYTQLWKEQGDLSCCLMDANGDIIAQGDDVFDDHVLTLWVEDEARLTGHGEIFVEGLDNERHGVSTLSAVDSVLIQSI